MKPLRPLDPITNRSIFSRSAYSTIALAFVPAGTVHNFINTGNTDLKLFTTYSPPNHAAGILQKTKAETKGYVPKGAIEQEG